MLFSARPDSHMLVPQPPVSVMLSPPLTTTVALLLLLLSLKFPNDWRLPFFISSSFPAFSNSCCQRNVRENSPLQVVVPWDCSPAVFISPSSRSFKHQGVQQTFHFALFLPRLSMRESCVLFRLRRHGLRDGGGGGGLSPQSSLPSFWPPDPPWLIHLQWQINLYLNLLIREADAAPLPRPPPFPLYSFSLYFPYLVSCLGCFLLLYFLPDSTIETRSVSSIVAFMLTPIAANLFTLPIIPC